MTVFNPITDSIERISFTVTMMMIIIMQYDPHLMVKCLTSVLPGDAALTKLTGTIELGMPFLVLAVAFWETRKRPFYQAVADVFSLEVNEGILRYTAQHTRFKN